MCSLPHTFVVIEWGGCEMRMASRPHGRDEKYVQDFDQKARGKRFLEDSCRGIIILNM
jgi:hypothetical protein